MTNKLVGEAYDLLDQYRFSDALKKYKLLLETIMEEGYNSDEIPWGAIRHNYQTCILGKEVDFLRILVEKNTTVYGCNIIHAHLSLLAGAHHACHKTCNQLIRGKTLSKEEHLEIRLLRVNCFLERSYIVKETQTIFFEDLNYLFVTLRNESKYKKNYKTFLLGHISSKEKVEFIPVLEDYLSDNSSQANSFERNIIEHKLNSLKQLAEISNTIESIIT